MFDQDSEETLKTSQQSAVNHVRTMLSAILADIGHIKALGQVEVKLNGSGLPLTSDSIFDLEVDFRTVKRTAALVNLAIKSALLDRLAETADSSFPTLRLADRLFRTG